MSNNSKIPNNFVFFALSTEKMKQGSQSDIGKKTVVALRESARREGGVISEAVWQGASGRCRAYSFKGTTTNYLYFKGTQHTLTSSTSPSRGHTPTIFTTLSRGHTVHTRVQRIYFSFNFYLAHTFFSVFFNSKNIYFLAFLD